MTELLGIFSAFGLSASAGLNAYIPLLTIALLAKFTNLIHLNQPWDVLTNWWVIGALILLSIVEFFADKFPAVNHVNDAVMTLIRPAAGAIAFAASANMITDVNPALAVILGLLVSGSVHAVKTLAVRPAVTVTTAGAGNAPVSALEDFISMMVSIIAIVVPVLIVCGLVLVAAWAIGKLFFSTPKNESAV
ncbi:MAG TPA: DUF4126 domain-containing protein [Bellilinea sp.]|nr:DUF4126 domain-containing protein [Bellilinea sp.]